MSVIDPNHVDLKENHYQKYRTGKYKSVIFKDFELWEKYKNWCSPNGVPFQESIEEIIKRGMKDAMKKGKGEGWKTKVFGS